MHIPGYPLIKKAEPMRVPLAILAILVLNCLAWLLFAPIPIVAQAWQAPTFPGYVGVHATNYGLTGLQRMPLPDISGPGHVRMQGMSQFRGAGNILVEPGVMYLALDSGRIVKFVPTNNQLLKTVLGNSDARILGFDFDEGGRIFAADAMQGLVAISPQGVTTPLVTQVGGKTWAEAQIRYANSVVVSSSGKVYFSDSTARFSAREFGGAARELDIVEHSCSGRVLEYDRASGVVRVVFQDLCFVDGLALSADESSLFVAETAEYRVWKIDPRLHEASAKKMALNGASPQARIILSNLPGFPDNLMRGLGGRIWLGLSEPRIPALDWLADKPRLRAIYFRLPKLIRTPRQAYGHVLAFDEEGKVLFDLQDPGGSYSGISGVLETEKNLYIQSRNSIELWWMRKPASMISQPPLANQ